MADDDDEKGSRDNTGRNAKPKSAQNSKNAPTGSLGTNKLTPQSPGLGGGSSRSQSTKNAEQSGKVAEPAQSKAAAPTKDDRIGFPETDDSAVNADHQKRERMIPKDSREHPDHPQHGIPEQKPPGPRISQSEYAKAFRAARANTQAMHQPQKRDIDPV